MVACGFFFQLNEPPPRLFPSQEENKFSLFKMDKKMMQQFKSFLSGKSDSKESLQHKTWAALILNVQFISSQIIWRITDKWLCILP